MAAIRTTQRRTQSESSLGKIQPVADRPANSVKRHPPHIFLTDASLQHQVFDETPNGIVREGRHDRRIHAKAASEAPGNVVFPPPSQARKCRVVEMRSSPGSRRSMTSPRLTRSHMHSLFDLIFSFAMF